MNKLLSNKYFWLGAATTLVTVAVATGAYLVSTRTVEKSPKPVFCTMEAKQCPDGKSYVGRTGPNCEFAACPSPSPEPTPVPVPSDCSGPGDTSCPKGYTCIQRCGPPVVRENDPPPGYYCETNAIASQPRMCPICLASNTDISTPNGFVNVKDVKTGMTVWSMDKNGKRVMSAVIRVSHTAVPSSHLVVHLVFADGREVWVSALHPTATGATVQDLRVSDSYDGSRLVTVESIPYWDRATYDLLPDSETGFYWANGVLLGSTLK